MKYLKLKIEDAVNATKAAIEEGVVPGGGSALVKIAAKLAAKNFTDAEKESAVGYRILVSALEMPLKQIAKNAGKGDGSVIVEKVKEGGALSGYDALNDAIVTDMLKAGIIDPVKVTRSAVQNAASATALLLTTEAIVADDPDEQKDANNSTDQAGGMGMM